MENNNFILNEGATKMLLDLIRSLVDFLKQNDLFENFKNQLLSPTKELFEMAITIAEEGI